MTAPLVAFAASVVATIVLIAFIPILDSNVEYMPADSWQMRAVAINGANFEHVWENGYILHYNSTAIKGKLCNGFAGKIRFVDSTIKAYDVIFTDRGCGFTLSGPSSMEMDRLFGEGLGHGMVVSETSDALALRDLLTNTTFVYGKPLLR